MTNFEAQKKAMSARLFLATLGACAEIEEVLAEARRNYYNNRWWPLEVNDWRIRMLVAGWSTRVSYAHIRHYESAVRGASEYGWEALQSLSRGELEELVGPLGLTESRILYFRSLQKFIDECEKEEFQNTDCNELIARMAGQVQGAGYKVAQCAVLYAKGYHCGVIPIDSGMVEMLQPLSPSRLPSGGKSHEVLRLWLEELVQANREEVLALAESVGFDLELPADCLPTWWVHLVLVYYKRLIWNKGVPRGPFRRGGALIEPGAVSLSFKDGGQRQSRVVVEGVDGAGKSTVAKLLDRLGYEVVHCPYSPDGNVAQRYRRLLEEVGDVVVFDRSFVSERVYGECTRSGSRLSEEEVLELAGEYSEKGVIFLHLEEPEQVLHDRRSKEDAKKTRRIVREYRKMFSKVEARACVYYLRTSLLAPEVVPIIFGWERESGDQRSSR